MIALNCWDTCWEWELSKLNSGSCWTITSQIERLTCKMSIIRLVFYSVPTWLFLVSFSLAAQLGERTDSSIEVNFNLIDEDEDQLRTKEYAFNPILARKEVKVGNFYAKKGNHRAAAARYLEATRWDPNYSNAYWKLGKSREKLRKIEGAIKAYQKYLNVEPQGKHVKTIKTKISDLANVSHTRQHDSRSGNKDP